MRPSLWPPRATVDNHRPEGGGAESATARTAHLLSVTDKPQLGSRLGLQPITLLEQQIAGGHL